MKMMGTLKAAVSVSGKGTLTFAGKTPKTLKAGRYTVSVDDQSKKAGLILGQTAKHPTTLSAAPVVGKSSHSVTLSAGKWYFAASAAGRRRTSPSRSRALDRERPVSITGCVCSSPFVPRFD